MQKVKVYILSGITISVVVILSVWIFSGKKQDQNNQALGKEANETIHYAGDVIGSRSATTTVGVSFGNNTTGSITATSSYVSRIGGMKQIAVYTIQAITASSTSRVNVEVQGSNDDECDTTATSAGNKPLVSEINWFSAGDHFNNKVHATSFTNASSTSFLSWLNPMNGAGQEIVLTNLSYECLRLNVAAASSTLWAQLRVRGN